MVPSNDIVSKSKASDIFIRQDSVDRSRKLDRDIISKLDEIIALLNKI